MKSYLKDLGIMRLKILVYFFSLLGSVLGVKVLSFQVDGKFSPASANHYATYNGILPSMNSMTICNFFEFIFERNIMVLWSHCSRLSADFSTCSNIIYRNGDFRFSILDQDLTVANVTLSQVWNSVCITSQFAGSKAIISAYVNGMKLGSKTSTLDPRVANFPGGGRLVLGQQQSGDTTGFDIVVSYSGRMSMFTIWNSVISEPEIQFYASCSSSLTGSVLDWSTSSWNVTSLVTISDVDKSVLCAPFPNKTYLVLPELREIDSAMLLCGALGGKPVVPLNPEENDALAKLGDLYEGPCQRNLDDGRTYWIGVISSLSTSYWLDSTTFNIINYTNWSPSALMFDNCAFILTGNVSAYGKWSTGVCSLPNAGLSLFAPRRTLCTVCEFRNNGTKTVFYLKGLCPQSKHDRAFTLDTDPNLKPYFKGAAASSLNFNASTMTWRLQNLQYSAEAFLPVTSVTQYPIGRQMWYLKNSPCVADNVPSELSISSCDLDNEFTCDDGTCISRLNRCDYKTDCADGSDELLCDILRFSADYDGTLPPKNTVNGKISLTPLQVYFNVTISEFDSIDTLTMKLSMSMKFSMAWRDRRIQYSCLEDDSFYNILSATHRSIIWTPAFSLDNAVTGSVNEDPFYLFNVQKDGHPIPTDLSNSRENIIFNGWDAILNWNRRYIAVFPCIFDLTYFPFDIQYCAMIFKMETAAENLVMFVPTNLTYTGTWDMVEFSLKNLSFIKDNNSEISTLVVTFSLERRYGYYLSNLFFQCLSLTILGYLTFFINLEDFTDRFMGALTVLLVFASLMISLNTTVPQTSYLKMVDVWLLFFFTYNAVITAFHILIDRKYKEEQKMYKLNRSAEETTEVAFFTKSSSSLTESLKLSSKNLDLGSSLKEDQLDTNQNDEDEESKVEMELELARKSCMQILFGKWASKAGNSYSLNHFAMVTFPLVMGIFIFIFSLISYFGARKLPAKFY